VVQVVNISKKLIVKIFKEKKMKKLIALVAAMVMVTGYAYAADWDFYGSARIQTFITDLDIANTDNFDETIQGNSRIGARVKVSDELTGGFEYGTGINLRKLYGEWNFGGGSFLVGQTYTPLNMFYSNQVYGADTGLLNNGGVYSGRHGMLRLKFGGFQVALVDPSTPAGAEVDMPAIEAKYSLKMGDFSAAIAGGYQTYDVVGADSVDSYVLALGGSGNFGPVTVGGNVYFGQNSGDLIAIRTSDNGWSGEGQAAVVGTTVVDNDCLGYLFVVGFKASDMLSFEAGYSYAETEFDTTGSTTDEIQAYYVQATVTLAPGVFFVPEIGVIDAKETGQEEATYYGVKWQINF
jgi:hypothetical protein